MDNGENIFHMPVASRNIAISLGKISGKNSDGTEEYNNAGEYWQNISVMGFRFRIGIAKYMPSGQTFQIFRRQLPPVLLNPFQAVCKHEVNVSMMQEIDNVAGSFLNKMGNFVDVADRTYFPLTPATLFGKSFFTHKPVVSALGINRNLWPSDGSNGYEDIKKHLEVLSEGTREESEKQDRIRLYPNPSNDGTFSLKSASEAVISTVRIYTMYGIPIRDSKYRSNRIPLTGATPNGNVLSAGYNQFKNGNP
ncbi:hypothetical protein [Fluviicola sp.]|uniref:hypothetical protein n=1 Tax=Fluviicola sp. TaxID=1917219 RepID=UPI0028347B19|nr:hypothetical protein [Fluviicola sp.]MDR0802901.1 hypothetical protein [Fluviicola sp.]